MLSCCAVARLARARACRTGRPGQHAKEAVCGETRPARLAMCVNVLYRDAALGCTSAMIDVRPLELLLMRRRS